VISAPTWTGIMDRSNPMTRARLNERLNIQ
jgi:hypothetical protein